MAEVFDQVWVRPPRRRMQRQVWLPGVITEVGTNGLVHVETLTQPYVPKMDFSVPHDATPGEEAPPTGGWVSRAAYATLEKEGAA